jgi:hypothetical protein
MSKVIESLTWRRYWPIPPGEMQRKANEFCPLIAKLRRAARCESSAINRRSAEIADLGEPLARLPRNHKGLRCQRRASSRIENQPGCCPPLEDSAMTKKRKPSRSEAWLIWRPRSGRPEFLADLPDRASCARRAPGRGITGCTISPIPVFRNGDDRPPMEQDA